MEDFLTCDSKAGVTSIRSFSLALFGGKDVFFVFAADVARRVVVEHGEDLVLLAWIDGNADPKPSAALPHHLSEMPWGKEEFHRLYLSPEVTFNLQPSNHSGRRFEPVLESH